MATVQERIKELEQPKDDRLLTLEVLRQLPADLPAPSISNHREPDATGRHWPAAYIGFSSGFSTAEKEAYDALEILRQLEREGWETAPATLVRLGTWRHSPQFGYQDDIPEKQGRDKVTETCPLCPLWVVPEQHCGTEVRCFMTAPNGRTYYIHPKDSTLRTRISAQRLEFRGGWRYELGTAKLIMPDSWITLHDKSGEPIAQREVHSRAFVDTEQGISGAIYWEPIAHTQDELPLSAADMLEMLRAA